MRYIRYIILIGNIGIAGLIYLYWILTVPMGSLQIIRITETYALFAIGFLYITLLPGPLYGVFPSLPYRAWYMRARRALGVSTFLYAFLHACFSFFGLLGGFPGLFFLDDRYLFAISLSFIAFVILLLLAATSFDYLVIKLGKKWKVLHRFVYLAGLLISIHALLLGSQFSDVSGIIPQIFFATLLFLLILESVRFDVLLHKRFHSLPRFGIAFAGTIGMISAGIMYLFSPTGATQSLNIHAAHIQLAKLAQQPQQFAVDISKIPGLDGDRNKRYTVSMSSDPQNPLPNQNVKISFRIFDASSGNPVEYFKFIYAKPMHMIVTNSNLTYFTHIHPTQVGQDFSITTQFPAVDMYHIYIEFQPYGGIEQQVAFTIPVENSIPITQSTQPADHDNTTKIFGSYAVTMHTHGALSASAMSFGSQQISFTIVDAKTKKPITTLKPYLASFGHLTMINESTYDFIHVHPYSILVPPPNANGGPTVDFLPIGIYGPFKPGMYRAFAEFNPDGTVFTADFTVKVN